MKKHNEPRFEWDPEEGIATCILTDGDNIFLGMAQCSEEDKDMMSEKTGYEIAISRAKIDYLKHIRDNILKPRLAALKQLYFSINQSKQYNEKSYENIMLCRQIHMTDTDLTVIKEDLARTKENLKDYIKQKGEFYKKVREERAKDKTN